MSVRLGGFGAFSAMLARLATLIACGSLVSMTLVEAWQVFARYVLNDSPVWTEPVALLLMSAAMMFGAASGVRSESHFGFFLAVHVSPPRVRVVLLAIARVIVASIGAVLAFWGAVLLVDGWSIPMAGAPLPQGLYFLPIGAGGALMVVFALERLVTAAPAPSAEAAPSAKAALTGERAATRRH
jgi:TRAP-type C4-dicarboxylate transport system permease small subunit